MDRGAWWAIVHRIIKVRQDLATKQPQYDSWHTGTGTVWTDKKSYCLERSYWLGDGRAETISNRRWRASCSFTHLCHGIGHVDACLSLWNFTTWRFTCRGLTGGGESSFCQRSSIEKGASREEMPLSCCPLVWHLLLVYVPLDKPKGHK